MKSTSKPTIWIWFDMDGTIYNLYEVENWLARLRADDETAYYEKGKHRRSIRRIREAIQVLRAQYDVKFGVISWLSMGATVDYQLRITSKKYEWTRDYLPELLADGAFYCVPYGTDKGKIALAHQDSPNTIHILIDDNKGVRADFRKTAPRMLTIDAKRGFIAPMKRIPAMVEKTGIWD